MSEHTRFAVCIRNAGYSASLELRKLYEVIEDLEAEKDQMIRIVGMTFPMRSNAVASSPVRSPTRMLTEGGATWTSETLCAAAPAGSTSANAARSPHLLMAGECVSG